MAGYLANLLPCHKGENRLSQPIERGSHPSTDLWKQRKAIYLLLVSLLSPSNPYLQMWSIALAAVKTAETRGQKQCSPFLFKPPSILGRPPWLIWEHIALEGSLRYKGHLMRRLLKLARSMMGEREEIFPKQKLSFESSKAKKIF